jgi:hypothetical protein
VIRRSLKSDRGLAKAAGFAVPQVRPGNGRAGFFTRVRRLLRPKPGADGQTNTTRSDGGFLWRHRAQAAVAVLGAVVLVAALVHWFSSPESYRPPVSDVAPPPKRVYNETLNGSQYENRDLGLAVNGPEQWIAALGARHEQGPAYEGLIVRMEDAGPIDEATRLRPLVSVVKQTLTAGSAREPVTFIQQQLLTPKKTLVDAPQIVQKDGRRLGRVAFEMKSGEGSIRIVQFVWIRGQEAIIVSAMAPSSKFEELRPTFDGVIDSMKLGL